MLSDKLRKYFTYKNGVYIELGAFDGQFQSNTKWLEDEFEWGGILIEPSLNAYNLCCSRRPNNKLFNCVCVSNEYKEETIKGDFIGTPMCSVNGKRQNRVPNNTIVARTLQSIINESKLNYFDFLSLDTEGYELEVLKGIDFTKQKIKYCLIEIYTKDKDTIFEFMKDKNYTFIENLSNFTKETHPGWDGTHNDYLFKLKI